MADPTYIPGSSSADYMALPDSSFVGPPAPPQVNFATQNSSWVDKMFSPSIESIKLYATPPPKLGVSESFSGQAKSQISQASNQATSQIANAVKVKVEKTPSIFSAISGAGPAVPGTYVFDPAQWGRSIYRNRVDQQYENTRAAQANSGFPLTDLSRKIPVHSEWNKPGYATELTPDTKFNFFNRVFPRKTESLSAIYAPVTKQDADLFSVAEFGPEGAAESMVGNPTQAAVAASVYLPSTVAKNSAQMAEDVVRHEASHSFSFANEAEKNQYVEAISQTSGLEMSPVFKGFAGLTYDAENKEFLGESANAPYPIQRFAEFAPAAGALQRYYASTHSGDRLDSPQKYDEWISRFDGLTEPQIRNLPVSNEVKRALLYRMHPRFGPTVNDVYRKILPATFGGAAPSYDFVPQTA